MENEPTRMYCLLLLKLDGKTHGGANPCQLGVVVVAEASPQLAYWQAMARYPGAQVLITMDITEVVEHQASVVSRLSSVAVDGRSLMNFRLQRVDGAEVF